MHTAADELVAPMVYFAKLNASDGSVAHRPPRALWGTRGYRSRVLRAVRSTSGGP